MTNPIEDLKRIAAEAVAPTDQEVFERLVDAFDDNISHMQQSTKISFILAVAAQQCSKVLFEKYRDVPASEMPMALAVGASVTSNLFKDTINSGIVRVLTLAEEEARKQRGQ